MTVTRLDARKLPLILRSVKWRLRVKPTKNIILERAEKSIEEVRTCRGKNKKEAWKTLAHHYQHFAENVGVLEDEGRRR